VWVYVSIVALGGEAMACRFGGQGPLLVGAGCEGTGGVCGGVYGLSGLRWEEYGVGEGRGERVCGKVQTVWEREGGEGGADRVCAVCRKAEGEGGLRLLLGIRQLHLLVFYLGYSASPSCMGATYPPLTQRSPSSPGPNCHHCTLIHNLYQPARIPGQSYPSASLPTKCPMVFAQPTIKICCNYGRKGEGRGLVHAKSLAATLATKWPRVLAAIYLYIYY